MPELRKDPVIGRWVIISTARGKRPVPHLEKEAEESDDAFCPFCYGNEGITPLEILAYRPAHEAENSPTWSLRVVPNKFPALQIEGELSRQGEGMYDKMNGIGAHEVVIESPDHHAPLSALSLRQIEDLFWAFRDRILDLKKDSRFRYILVFKNHGASAGASLPHSHSQIIALPIVPKRALEELQGARQHYELKERCIYCDIIHQESEQQNRVIFENDQFLTIAPYAPRFPFETWILPKKHRASFEQAENGTFASLAEAMKDILSRMSVVLNNPHYNFTIHNAPFETDCASYFHWHIEIMPKLSLVAGFEWGSGFYINSTPPEEAAEELRNAFTDRGEEGKEGE